jgi:hypothetical protein
MKQIPRYDPVASDPMSLAQYQYQKSRSQWVVKEGKMMVNRGNENTGHFSVPTAKRFEQLLKNNHLK